ncbi:hypothetical protein [Sodalis sp.]|uniref:hypothetical protein n=1 Tax=Sodalis sp. (in: enterobacteria) TaxID=1898979 RepID=UPI00387324EC
MAYRHTARCQVVDQIVIIMTQAAGGGAVRLPVVRRDIAVLLFILPISSSLAKLRNWPHKSDIADTPSTTENVARQSSDSYRLRQAQLTEYLRA